MAVIRYVDDRDEVGALTAELHDEWVVAMIETDDGDVFRHCIPREHIEEVIGHESGEDVTIV